MGTFSNLDDVENFKLAGTNQNSHDQVHSGQSLTAVTTSEAAQHTRYFGNSIQTMNMASDSMNLSRTTDYSRTHLVNTTSTENLMAPNQNEHFQAAMQHTSQFQTRTDNWTANQLTENIWVDQYQESHAADYQLLSPNTQIETTPTHQLKGNQLQHQITSQTVQTNTHTQTIQTATITGNTAQINANQVLLGGSNLTMNPGSGSNGQVGAVASAVGLMDVEVLTPYQFKAREAKKLQDIQTLSTHYFVVEKTISLSQLAGELYPDGGTVKQEFLQINQVIASGGEVTPGQFLYIPPANGCPVVSVITAKLQQLDAQHKTMTQDEQNTMGVWHAVGGAGLFMAEAGGEISKNYLEQQREDIETTLKKIKSLGKQAKAASKAGDKAKLAETRAKIHVAGEELDKNIKTLIQGITYKRMIVKEEFTQATKVPWRREILDLKRAGVKPEVIDSIDNFHKVAITSSKAIKVAGGAAIVLTVGDAGYNIAETCKENPGGKLCYREVATQTAGTAASLGAGEVGGIVAGEVVCNIALDLETAGTGALVCGILAPAFGSMAAGSVVGAAAESAAGAGFDAATNRSSTYMQIYESGNFNPYGYN